MVLWSNLINPSQSHFPTISSKIWSLHPKSNPSIRWKKCNDPGRHLTNWPLTFGKLTSDKFSKDLRYTTKLENLIKLLVLDLNYVKRSKDERLNMYGHRNICCGWDSKSDHFFQNLRPNKFSRANSGSGENGVGKLAILREQIQMDRNAAPSAKQENKLHFCSKCILNTFTSILVSRFLNQLEDIQRKF